MSIDFRKIDVWRKAHRLTLQVYEVTRNFPTEELYGLTSQLRRASASVPANVAEGCGRGTQAELARFLHIAMGSASELEYHLLLAHDLQFIPSEPYAQLDQEVNEVKRMLNGFIKTVKSNI
jgi:four helix bundle protein